MRRKPVETLRVPLNCLISPVTKEGLTGIQNETRESQGEIVDRAIALLAFGEEITPLIAKKQGRREKAILGRAACDSRALKTGRTREIDYSDIDSAPTTSVANLDAVGPPLIEGRGKISVENWRAGRKPLLKPGEQKK